jgi:glycosyltransferase involved in cell wall biosynthesis
MRILYVHNSLTSFVRLDLEILQSAFQVTEYAVDSYLTSPIQVYRKVRSHDLVFGRFASWHTFWPVLFARMLKKPALVVTGGYDLARLPGAGYGSQRGGFKRWITNTTLRLSTRLITNSRFSLSEAVHNAGVKEQKLALIPDGIPDPFGNLLPKSEPPLILSVGNVERDNLLRKGHLPFAKAAALMPELEFRLVGKIKDSSAEELAAIAPNNLHLTGWASDELLHSQFCQAWVYVQPSLHESFGVSVAEAMLAGCIPVASSNGALPEVVGDAGILMETTDPQEIADSIRQALQCTQADRLNARERILSEFPLEKRRQAIIGLCQSCIDR